MRISLNYRSTLLLFFFITSYAILNAQQIARVQFAHTYPAYPAVTAAFTSNNTAGNAIVVMASWYLTPGTPTISDTQGNTYMLLPPLTGGGAGNGEQTSILIWYALNIAAGANTVTISGAGIDVGLTAVEYSGVAGVGTTSTLPYFGGTPTTTPTSNSFTPSGAGSLLFVAFADETNPQNSIAAGSGYTLIQGDGNHVDIEEDNVNSSAGPQTASISVNIATWSWAMYVVEFLPAGGTPPTGTVLWTNLGDGSGFSSIVPAVPASTGVADIFGLQNDGTVAAITSAGTTAWSADVSQAGMVVPDFQGGLVLVQQYGAANGNNSIVKLDGITGQPYPSYLPNPATAGLGDAAVHTDGTIFALQGGDTTSVVGINPTAGTQIFGVQLLGSSQDFSYFNVLTNLMIAGDGYAYLAYSYVDGSAYPFVAHLMLFRVDSSGNSTTLDILDLPNFKDGGLMTFQANLITNADTGILISWGDTYVPIPDVRPRVPSGAATRTRAKGAKMTLPMPLRFGPTYGMAIIAGTSVSMITPPSVSGQVTNISPVLQREDGSFVGTVGVSSESNPQYNMAAFDQTGNLLWAVTNDQPQIATSDGGVIGQSETTYDQNGNVTGQVVIFTQSWLGNAYQYGSAVSQLLENPLYLAASFAPEQGANESRNATSVREDWFPVLAHCTTTPGCVGPNEAIYNALADLVARLTNPALIPNPESPGQTTTMAALAQTYVFNKLSNGPAGQPPYTTAKFIAYLTNKPRPGFYNGPLSSYCYSALQGGGPDSFCNGETTLSHFLFNLPLVGGLLTSQSVGGYFQAAGSNVVGGITGTPSRPLLTYFAPAFILLNAAGMNLGNEAAILHEALHGFTGLYDSTLLSNFGYNQTQGSCNVTTYMQQVLAFSPGLNQTAQPCN
jgi:hypothetical protein